MTILQKDYAVEFIETTTTSMAGSLPTTEYWASTPATSPTTIADSSTDEETVAIATAETPGYKRYATWTEVKGIWPWLKTDCAIQKKILQAIYSSASLGTVFATYFYRKSDIYQIEGGRLQVYTVYIAIQNENNWLGFYAVTGKDYVTVESNPVYNPNYEYVEGSLASCD